MFTFCRRNVRPGALVSSDSCMSCMQLGMTGTSRVCTHPRVLDDRSGGMKPQGTWQNAKGSHTSKIVLPCDVGAAKSNMRYLPLLAHLNYATKHASSGLACFPDCVR